MEKLKNIYFDEWSKKAISNPLMQGNTIEFIFPAKFEKYCKIFHPFYVSPDFEKMQEDVWNENNLGVIEYLDGKHSDHSKAIESYVPKPQSTLAKLYDKRFDKHFTIDLISRLWGKNQPKWFLCPDEGTIDISILSEITSLLVKHSKSQSCFCHYVLYAIDTYEETIFKGTLDELPKTINIGLAGTPNTIWPESNEWYLYTNYDAEYSLVGGSESLIDEILTNKAIESLEWNVDDVFYSKRTN